MVRLLKLLLAYQLKQKKPIRQSSGFTLIELLVGLLLAFLIILPLLGFMVNMVQTDRQEQAKATSEQEIQAALSYIGRDVEQAVYIYDGLGLAQISQYLPPVATPKKSVPVLAFWKRKFFDQVLQTGAGNDDAFAYGLVVYYLIRDPNCINNTWSCTAQIGRVELHQAVMQGTTPRVPAKPANFPLFTLNQTGALAAASFEQKMNAWPNPKPAPSYTAAEAPEILIDYVDQSPINPADPNSPNISCPTDGRAVPRPDYPTPDPATNYTTIPYPYRQVPTAAAMTTAFGNQLSGFYACVDTDKTLAKIYIRGNALARLKQRTSPPTYVARQSVMSYFPTASIQVKGRGFFGDTRN